MTHRILALLWLGALSLAPLVAQELEAPPEAPSAEAAASEDTGELAVPGFIFNTTNLLLDIDSYQGGFGGKLRYDDYGLRALVSLGYQSTNSVIETGLGITYERPFFTGRVVPYWGLLAGVVFDSERIEVDADNYTQTRVVTGSAGAVLGIEVLIFDFLSVFGEYQLALDVSHTVVEQSVGGTVSENSTTNYAFGADLGNNAALGVVVYLRPLGIIENEE